MVRASLPKRFSRLVRASFGARSTNQRSAKLHRAVELQLLEQRQLLSISGGTILWNPTYGESATAPVSTTISNSTSSLSAAPATGSASISAAAAGTFDIVINPGTGLASNAAALAAFNRAAAEWEAVISSPVQININANLANLSLGVLGSTGAVLNYASYTSVRNALAARSSRPNDGILASLPTAFNATIPAGTTLDKAYVVIARANQKALGLVASDTAKDADMSFTTNTSTAVFDYDRSNGVTPGTFDFQSVVAHEIGHVLGFLSDVDDYDYGNPDSNPTPLDLFRFATTNLPTTAAQFTSNVRDMRPNVAASTSDTVNVWRMSTGDTTGDGNQASHWRADEIAGANIGIMDPTLSPGQTMTIKTADIRAMDLIGYNTTTNTQTTSNTAPTASVVITPSQPTATDTLTALANVSDADGDSVTLTYVWKVNGATVRTFATNLLTDTYSGSKNAGDVVSVSVTPNDGKVNGTTVTASVTIVTPTVTAPAAKAATIQTNEDTPVTFNLTASGAATIYTVRSLPARGSLYAGTGTGGHLITSGDVSGGYVLTSNTLTYVPAADDNGSRTFSFTATDGVNATNAALITLSIAAVNDAPVFTLGGDQVISEDAGAQTISGFATNIADGPVTATDETTQIVSFVVSNGDPSLFAVQPAISANGTLTYTPAADAHGAVNVSVRALDNGGVLNGGTNSSLDQSFQIIINPVTDYSVTDASLAEGNAGTSDMTFTISRDDDTGFGSVDWSAVAGTADIPADLLASSGTVSFIAGQLSTQVTVPVVGDTVYEPNETFNVKLANAVNGTIKRGTAVGTIVNDDTAPVTTPSITITDVKLAEGNSGTKSFTFTVKLSAASTKSISVKYATASGTATSGTDFTAASGTLTFAAGTTSKTITVLGKGDLTLEQNETFKVNLTTPVNATIADAQGVGTILNDEKPKLAITGVSLTEGPGGTTKSFTFKVTLSAPSTSSITVKFATANGTAIAGTDYTATSGTLTFAAGTTSKTITVLVKGDATKEANETFLLKLTSPVNALIGTGQATGTIVNDD